MVVSLSGLIAACGGEAFTSVDGDGGGSNTGSTSGASSSGTAGSGGSSSGTASSGTSSSGSGGSSGSGSASGSGGSTGSGSTGSSGASSGGGSSGGGSSGGGCVAGCDGGGPSPCPAKLPTAGGSCSQAGLECEYGANPVQSCNFLATCTQSLWQIQSPSSSANCSTSPGPSCPSSFSSVPQGSHCGSLYGLICNYPQGRCECTVSGGLVPLDASAVATWQCQDPSGGCPIPRAPLGSACTQPNLNCDYGACYIQGGSAETCTNGVWRQSFVACPL
jgi:hypothetical protein